MLRFILSRIIQSATLIIGVTFLVFFVINLVTDDFFVVGSLDPRLYPLEVAEYRAGSGFSETVAFRYLDWGKKVLMGELGVSNKRPNSTVISIIQYHLPKSLLLVGTSLLFSILISTPIGIVLAAFSGKWFIRWFETVVAMGIGVPSFVPAIIGIYMFSIVTNWLPINGVYAGETYVWWKQIWLEGKYAILPTLGLSIGIISTLVGFIRTTLVNIFHEDYIRTARAKGVKEFTIICKHALKNAAIPWFTNLGMSVPVIFSELFIVERLFSWPGITSRMLEALGRYDYPLILGVSIFLCLILVGINLIVELLYGWANPQIRYSWGDE